MAAIATGSPVSRLTEGVRRSLLMKSDPSNCNLFKRSGCTTYLLFVLEQRETEILGGTIPTLERRARADVLFEDTMGASTRGLSAGVAVWLGVLCLEDLVGGLCLGVLVGVSW